MIVVVGIVFDVFTLAWHGIGFDDSGTICRGKHAFWRVPVFIISPILIRKNKPTANTSNIRTSKLFPGVDH